MSANPRTGLTPEQTAAIKARLWDISDELESVWRRQRALSKREQELRDEQTRLNAQVYRG